MENGPLFRNFRSTSIFKAFILNALSVSLISILAVFLQKLFSTFPWFGKNDVVTGLVVFFLTFIAAMLIYFVMYKLFGYGGGMVTTSKTGLQLFQNV